MCVERRPLFSWKNHVMSASVKCYAHVPLFCPLDDLGGLATTGPTSPRGVGTSLRSAWVPQAQSADSWQSWGLKLLGSKPKARALHGGDSLSIHTVDVRGRHFLLKHSRCSKKGVWRGWRKWNHLRGVENPQPRSIMVL